MAIEAVDTTFEGSRGEDTFDSEDLPVSLAWRSALQLAVMRIRFEFRFL